jgi:hypothetical protein
MAGAVPSLQAATNLVQNPGFEAGNFTSWTQSGNTGPNTVVNSAKPRTGTYAATTGPIGSLGFLSQIIPTTPGTTYIIRFFLANPAGGSGTEYKVVFNGVTLVDQVNSAVFEYTEFVYYVVATSSTATLQFGFRQDPSYFYLDDVFVAPNAVQNPGFETGTFSSWTQSGNTGSTFVSTVGPHAGTYAARFHPVGSLGFLSQNLSTVPGMTYTLRFLLANPNGGTGTEFRVAFNGVTLIDQINPSSPGPNYVEFVFTGLVATSSTTSLQFGFRHDPDYFYLDDVTVTSSLDQSILYSSNSDGTIVGFDSAGNRTTVSSLGNPDHLEGLTFDNLGNLYVADRDANSIFKFDPAGHGTIFASPLSSPQGVAFDGNGYVYVAEPAGLKKIDPAGTVTVAFPSPTPYPSAELGNSLEGIAFDYNGALFVANYRIGGPGQDKIDGFNGAGYSTGTSPPFGVGVSGSDVFATLPCSSEILKNAADIKLNLIKPTGLAFSRGELYVADQSANAILKLDKTGQVSIFVDSDLVGPNFLVFGPPISAPLISIAPHVNFAPFEDAGISGDSLVVTRSGQLNQTVTVLLQTVDASAYSPQILHQRFDNGNMMPHYYSTNDPQFQDACRALPGKDYQPVSMSLVFAPGETSKSVTIPIIDNNAFDGRRQFKVALKAMTYPLTVGSDLTETIIDDEAISEVGGLTNIQSNVTSTGTRNFSGSLTILNVSATAPVRVRLEGRAGFTNPPTSQTNPTPTPPACSFDPTPLATPPPAAGGNPTPTPPPTPTPIALGTFPVTFSGTGSAVVPVNVLIPAPQGNAYGYNTWWWVYAIVEQQINGTWTAAAAPWLVIDGVRLSAGYINPDGSTTPRAIFQDGGINGGTPGYVVGGNGNAGSIGGATPSPSPTPPVPGLNPFRFDGQPDFSGLGAGGAGYQQVSTGQKLYAAVRQASGRTFLYVATQSPGTGGDSSSKDIFVFVTDQPLGSATEAAPWGKVGRIACSISKPFLAGESRDDYLAWYNCGNGAQSVKLNTTTGVIEGVLDLGSAFGSVPPVLYLAAASYGTLNGGSLMAQSPAGNNDANIDPTEFLAIPVPALIDQNADGKYDRLDPAVGFRLSGQRTTGGQSSSTGNDFTLTWPAYPGKMYQVYSKNSLTNTWQAVTNALFTAPSTPPFMDTLSYTDLNAIPSGHRFYKVQIQ